MTQPAVSSAIARLRNLFQDRLFIKTSRGVEPTPRATALWPRIHQMLEDVYDAVRPNAFDPTQTDRQFRIAMNDISAALIVMHLHRIVHAQAPNASVVLVPYDPALAEARLVRGELDFLLSVTPPRFAEIRSTQLWSAGWVVGGRPGHPLLTKQLSLADFCLTPQLAINESGDEAVSTLVDETLKQQGLSRNIKLTINQFTLAPGVLKSSDLITVLPTRFATDAATRGLIDTRPLPFRLPDAIVFLSWHWRSDASPALTWMKQCLLDAAISLNSP